MYTRTNRCYNERGSRTSYVRSSIPHSMWKCVCGRLFNRGDERVAACSISRAAGLSLATAATNETHEIYERARTGDDRSVLTLYNKHPVLVIVQSCTNMLTIFLPGARGGAVVKAPRYKPVGRGFDSRWCHWNFSVT